MNQDEEITREFEIRTRHNFPEKPDVDIIMLNSSMKAQKKYQQTTKYYL